ncbi:unnamed protein product [Phytophthora fragariaefolia]|uniref:Unnamed protein product n=1 Tax=Phytophthora fragariaefolia TaxID=1490495 RepID=A0A9W6XRV0_9STRA|nr:unnamed protein product [Phytophthora fragariaefolia]
MEISDLLNSDEDCASWEFEPSETEEEQANANASIIDNDEDGATESDGETAQEAEVTPVAHGRTGNPYVDSIGESSGLHIIRRREAQAAYTERGELGLFSLFFTRDFRDSLLSWTNKLLKEKGKVEATV